MWRFSGNPIIGRHGNKRANSVFNSAVVPFEDGFAGVFRCDSRCHQHGPVTPGRSDDGYPLGHRAIEPVQHGQATPEEIRHKEYRYDRPGHAPWTASTMSPGATATTAPPSAWHGRRTSRPSISWKMLFLPYNRNGVLFPRKIRRPVHDDVPSLATPATPPSAIFL